MPNSLTAEALVVVDEPSAGMAAVALGAFSDDLGVLDPVSRPRRSSSYRAATGVVHCSTWPGRWFGGPERRSVAVAADGSQVVPYLNRLSDLLWTLARWVDQDSSQLASDARGVADH